MPDTATLTVLGLVSPMPPAAAFCCTRPAIYRPQARYMAIGAARRAAPNPARRASPRQRGRGAEDAAPSALNRPSEGCRKAGWGAKKSQSAAASPAASRASTKVLLLMLPTSTSTGRMLARGPSSRTASQ